MTGTLQFETKFMQHSGSNSMHHHMDLLPSICLWQHMTFIVFAYETSWLVESGAAHYRCSFHAYQGSQPVEHTV